MGSILATFGRATAVQLTVQHPILSGKPVDLPNLEFLRLAFREEDEE
jgi:hypothetical protein